MTAADLEPAASAILADEWGDRRAWFDFALRSPACHVVVAEADGDIVGTGVATVNGPVAWIGTIWVAPAHRRHGPRPGADAGGHRRRRRGRRVARSC